MRTVLRSAARRCVIEGARLTLLISSLVGGTPPAVGSEIPYVPASPELNEKAKTALDQLFGKRSATEVSFLFGAEAIICGPFLWRNLRTRPGLAAQGVPTTIVMGSTSREAMTFRTKQAREAFKRTFLAAYPPDPHAIVRRIKPTEGALLYATQPIPISEPIFVVETHRHKFVANFDDQGHLFWVDDYLHLP